MLYLRSIIFLIGMWIFTIPFTLTSLLTFPFPANQQARYRQKTSSVLGDTPKFTPISNNMNNSAIIDNYSSSLKRNSSGDRLNKMNHIERMF